MKSQVDRSRIGDDVIGGNDIATGEAFTDIWGRSSTESRAGGLPTHVARDLAGRLRGQVILPGQDGYDTLRAPWNQAVEQRPALIVSAADVADATTAVAFARQHRLPVAVQCSGHGVTVPADDALLVRTARMDEVQIDPDARTARIGAGVRWEQVIHEAAAFGLAPLNGSAPFVGAVGYILGGGLGLLARRYGYAADHVRSIDVITADGELHSATPDQDEDLFWGVRGSVGNLGLVTSMEIDLHPVARLYGGSLFFPGEWTPRLLHVYSEWAAAAPDELTSSVALLRLPPLPGVPEHLCGRLVAAVRVAYIGHAEDGETLLRPLRSVGRPLLDSVSDMPYTAIGSIHNEPNTPIPAHQDTTLLGELSPAAIDALLSVSGPEVESPLFVVELRQLGGALARPPQLASAVSHRDAAFTLMAVTPLIPERTAGIEEHTALLLERMAPYSTGGILLNFLTRNGVTPERIRAAYSSETLARLVALKGSYDPENFFRFNHNILRAAACNDDGSAPDS